MNFTEGNKDLSLLYAHLAIPNRERRKNGPREKSSKHPQSSNSSLYPSRKKTSLESKSTRLREPALTKSSSDQQPMLTQQQHGFEQRICNGQKTGHEQKVGYEQKIVYEQINGFVGSINIDSTRQKTHSLSPEGLKEKAERGVGSFRQPSYDDQSMSASVESDPRSRPIVRLTLKIIETYSEINKKHRLKKKLLRPDRSPDHHLKSMYNNGWDDANLDYIISEGEIINHRYRVRDIAGKGAFGKVIRMYDSILNRDVAIKISKSTDSFLAAAKNEVEMLSIVRDGAKRFNIVELYTHFTYRNHEFMVFEMLSMNLFEVLKSTQFLGVSFRSNRDFAKQLLTALSFLRHPQVDIIHCDIKPENILLRHPMGNDVKLVDFGSSCRSYQTRGGSYIQSRFYRSPEIMLGLPFNYAIDMWSLGCIMAEMHTGRPIFIGADTASQMRSIVQVLGIVPSYIVNRSPIEHRSQLFERGYDGLWTVKQLLQGKQVLPSQDPMVSLLSILGAPISRKKKMFPIDEPGESSCCYDMFVDLIFRMLCYDPEQRISPDEALRHPYFQYKI